MIEAYTQVSRSGSVARPIMKDSHSFDLGSNPNRSMILPVMIDQKLFRGMLMDYEKALDEDEFKKLMKEVEGELDGLGFAMRYRMHYPNVPDQPGFSSISAGLIPGKACVAIAMIVQRRTIVRIEWILCFQLKLDEKGKLIDEIEDVEHPHYYGKTFGEGGRVIQFYQEKTNSDEQIADAQKFFGQFLEKNKRKISDKYAQMPSFPIILEYSQVYCDFSNKFWDDELIAKLYGFFAKPMISALPKGIFPGITENH